MGKAKQKQANNLPVIAFVVGLAALIGVTIFVMTRKTDPQPVKGCAHSAVKVEMNGVEQIPCVGQEHVADTVTVKYNTDTPTSGDHHASWVPNGGLYTAPQVKEQLVHNLEHGWIVIYYDKAKLSSSDLDALRSVAQSFKEPWGSVIAVPRTDAQAPIVLTAWEHRLTLKGYDKAVIDTFVDTYRGRGPENPMR